MSDFDDLELDLGLLDVPATNAKDNVEGSRQEAAISGLELQPPIVELHPTPAESSPLDAGSIFASQSSRRNFHHTLETTPSYSYNNSPIFGGPRRFPAPLPFDSFANSEENEFWQNLEQLQEEIQSVHLYPRNQDYSRESVIKKLQEIISNVCESIGNLEPPVYVCDNRSIWENTSYCEENDILEIVGDARQQRIRFDSSSSILKFVLITKVMHKCFELLIRDEYSTKRDIYYQDPGFFESQSNLDDAVDTLSCMVKVPRLYLHVLATSKGLIAGDLTYLESENGRAVDCRQTQNGVNIPDHIHAIRDMRTRSAKFVLLVEKDATFQELLDAQIPDKLHCIILTGKGFPDINTRLMARKLWDKFRLPMLALGDPNIYGIEIINIYKFGSRNLAADSNEMAIPCLRWLGVLPTELEKMALPPSALVPLTQQDRQKCTQLLQREYYKKRPLWLQEIQSLLRFGFKGEIQSLSKIRNRYLTEVYLSNKIRGGSWI